MKKTKLFIINSIIIMSSSLIIRAISSVFDIFIANKIGAEAIGTYSIILSIYMFTVTLATSGINLASTKVISEELESSNIYNVIEVVKRCIIYSLIMGVFSCILLIVFSPYICKRWFMSKLSPNILYILAISLPFVSMHSAIAGYFFAIRNIITTCVSQIICQIIRIGSVFTLITFVFYNNSHNSIMALIISNTFSEILTFIFIYISYKKEIKKYNRLIIKGPALTKRILKISLPIAITSYIRSGLNTIKQIMIPIRLKLSGISYEKAISEYGIICAMAMPIIMFPSIIVYSYSSLLVPEFSRLNVQNNKDTINSSINKLFKITLYFSIAITGLLMYYGKDIGTLLYNSPNVGWYIKIIAPLVTLIYLDNVIDNILKGLGKQVNVMWCNIVDLIVSVSFIYFLLPKFGITGYIVVIYMSEILNYIISVCDLFKETNLTFKYFEWLIFPTICIILSIFITNFFNFFSIKNTLPLALSLILKISISIIIYIMFLHIVYILTKKSYILK